MPPPAHTPVRGGPEVPSNGFLSKSGLQLVIYPALEGKEARPCGDCAGDLFNSFERKRHRDSGCPLNAGCKPSISPFLAQHRRRASSSVSSHASSSAATPKLVGGSGTGAGGPAASAASLTSPLGSKKNNNSNSFKTAGSGSKPIAPAAKLDASATLPAPAAGTSTASITARPLLHIASMVSAHDHSGGPAASSASSSSVSSARYYETAASTSIFSEDGGSAAAGTPAEETAFLRLLAAQQHAIAQKTATTTPAAAGAGVSTGSGGIAFSHASLSPTPTPRSNKTSKVIPESMMAGVEGWSSTLRGSDYGRQKGGYGTAASGRRSSRPHNTASSASPQHHHHHRAPLPLPLPSSTAASGGSHRSRRRSSEDVLTATAALFATELAKLQRQGSAGAPEEEEDKETSKSARERKAKEDQVLREWALRHGLLSPTQGTEATVTSPATTTTINNSAAALPLPAFALQLQQPSESAHHHRQEVATFGHAIDDSGRSTMTITEESKVTLMGPGMRGSSIGSSSSGNEDGEEAVIMGEAEASALAAAVAMAAIISARDGNSGGSGSSGIRTEAPQVVTTTKALPDGTLLITARSVEEGKSTRLDGAHDGSPGSMQQQEVRTFATTEVVVELSPVLSLLSSAPTAPTTLTTAASVQATGADEREVAAEHGGAEQQEQKPLSSLSGAFTSTVEAALMSPENEAKETKAAPTPAAASAPLHAAHGLSSSSLDFVEIVPRPTAVKDPLPSLSREQVASPASVLSPSPQEAASSPGEGGTTASSTTLTVLATADEKPKEQKQRARKNKASRLPLDPSLLRAYQHEQHQQHQQFPSVPLEDLIRTVEPPTPEPSPANNSFALLRGEWEEAAVGASAAAGSARSELTDGSADNGPDSGRQLAHAGSGDKNSAAFASFRHPSFALLADGRSRSSSASSSSNSSSATKGSGGSSVLHDGAYFVRPVVSSGRRSQRRDDKTSGGSGSSYRFRPPPADVKAISAAAIAAGAPEDVPLREGRPKHKEAGVVLPALVAFAAASKLLEEKEEEKEKELMPMPASISSFVEKMKTKRESQHPAPSASVVAPVFQAAAASGSLDGKRDSAASDPIDSNGTAKRVRTQALRPLFLASEDQSPEKGPLSSPSSTISLGRKVGKAFVPTLNLTPNSAAAMAAMAAATAAQASTAAAETAQALVNASPIKAKSMPQRKPSAFVFPASSAVAVIDTEEAKGEEGAATSSAAGTSSPAATISPHPPRHTFVLAASQKARQRSRSRSVAADAAEALPSPPLSSNASPSASPAFASFASSSPAEAATTAEAKQHEPPRSRTAVAAERLRLRRASLSSPPELESANAAPIVAPLPLAQNQEEELTERPLPALPTSTETAGTTTSDRLPLPSPPPRFEQQATAEKIAIADSLVSATAADVLTLQEEVNILPLLLMMLAQQQQQQQGEQLSRSDSLAINAEVAAIRLALEKAGEAMAVISTRNAAVKDNKEGVTPSAAEAHLAAVSHKITPVRNALLHVASNLQAISAQVTADIVASFAASRKTLKEVDRGIVTVALLMEGQGTAEQQQPSRAVGFSEDGDCHFLRELSTAAHSALPTLEAGLRQSQAQATSASVSRLASPAADRDEGGPRSLMPQPSFASLQTLQIHVRDFKLVVDQAFHVLKATMRSKNRRLAETVAVTAEESLSDQSADDALQESDDATGGRADSAMTALVTPATAAVVDASSSLFASAPPTSAAISVAEAPLTAEQLQLSSGVVVHETILLMPMMPTEPPPPPSFSPAFLHSILASPPESSRATSAMASLEPSTAPSPRSPRSQVALSATASKTEPSEPEWMPASARKEKDGRPEEPILKTSAPSSSVTLPEALKEPRDQARATAGSKYEDLPLISVALPPSFQILPAQAKQHSLAAELRCLTALYRHLRLGVSKMATTKSPAGKSNGAAAGFDEEEDDNEFFRKAVSALPDPEVALLLLNADEDTGKALEEAEGATIAAALRSAGPYSSSSSSSSSSVSNTTGSLLELEKKVAAVKPCLHRLCYLSDLAALLHGPSSSISAYEAARAQQRLHSAIQSVGELKNTLLGLGRKILSFGVAAASMEPVQLPGVSRAMPLSFDFWQLVILLEGSASSAHGGGEATARSEASISLAAYIDASSLLRIAETPALQPVIKALQLSWEKAEAAFCLFSLVDVRSRGAQSSSLAFLLRIVRDATKSAGNASSLFEAVDEGTREEEAQRAAAVASAAAKQSALEDAASEARAMHSSSPSFPLSASPASSLDSGRRTSRSPLMGPSRSPPLIAVGAEHSSPSPSLPVVEASLLSPASSSASVTPTNSDEIPRRESCVKQSPVKFTASPVPPLRDLAFSLPPAAAPAAVSAGGGASVVSSAREAASSRAADAALMSRVAALTAATLALRSSYNTLKGKEREERQAAGLINTADGEDAEVETSDAADPALIALGNASSALSRLEALQGDTLAAMEELRLSGLDSQRSNGIGGSGGCSARSLSSRGAASVATTQSSSLASARARDVSRSRRETLKLKAQALASALETAKKSLQEVERAKLEERPKFREREQKRSKLKLSLDSAAARLAAAKERVQGALQEVYQRRRETKLALAADKAKREQRQDRISSPTHSSTGTASGITASLATLPTPTASASSVSANKLSLRLYGGLVVRGSVNNTTQAQAQAHEAQSSAIAALADRRNKRRKFQKRYVFALGTTASERLQAYVDSAIQALYTAANDENTARELLKLYEACCASVFVARARNDGDGSHSSEGPLNASLSSATEGIARFILAAARAYGAADELIYHKAEMEAEWTRDAQASAARKAEERRRRKEAQAKAAEAAVELETEQREAAALGLSATGALSTSVPDQQPPEQRFLRPFLSTEAMQRPREDGREEDMREPLPTQDCLADNASFLFLSPSAAFSSVSAAVTTKGRRKQEAVLSPSSSVLIENAPITAEPQPSSEDDLQQQALFHAELEAPQALAPERRSSREKNPLQLTLDLSSRQEDKNSSKASVRASNAAAPSSVSASLSLFSLGAKLSSTLSRLEQRRGHLSLVNALTDPPSSLRTINLHHDRQAAQAPSSHARQETTATANPESSTSTSSSASAAAKETVSTAQTAVSFPPYFPFTPSATPTVLLPSEKATAGSSAGASLLTVPLSFSESSASTTTVPKRRTPTDDPCAAGRPSLVATAAVQGSAASTSDLCPTPSLASTAFKSEPAQRLAAPGLPQPRSARKASGRSALGASDDSSGVGVGVGMLGIPSLTAKALIILPSAMPAPVAAVSTASNRSSVEARQNVEKEKDTSYYGLYKEERLVDSERSRNKILLEEVTALVNRLKGVSGHYRTLLVTIKEKKMQQLPQAQADLLTKPLVAATTTMKKANEMLATVTKPSTASTGTLLLSSPTVASVRTNSSFSFRGSALTGGGLGIVMVTQQFVVNFEQAVRAAEFSVLGLEKAIEGLAAVLARGPMPTKKALLAPSPSASAPSASSPPVIPRLSLPFGSAPPLHSLLPKRASQASVDASARSAVSLAPSVASSAHVIATTGRTTDDQRDAEFRPVFKTTSAISMAAAAAVNLPPPPPSTSPATAGVTVSEVRAMWQVRSRSSSQASTSARSRSASWSLSARQGNEEGKGADGLPHVLIRSASTGKVEAAVKVIELGMSSKQMKNNDWRDDGGSVERREETVVYRHPSFMRTSAATSVAAPACRHVPVVASYAKQTKEAPEQPVAETVADPPPEPAAENDVALPASGPAAAAWTASGLRAVLRSRCASGSGPSFSSASSSSASSAAPATSQDGSSGTSATSASASTVYSVVRPSSSATGALQTYRSGNGNGNAASARSSHQRGRSVEARREGPPKGAAPSASRRDASAASSSSAATATSSSSFKQLPPPSRTRTPTKSILKKTPVTPPAVAVSEGPRFFGDKGSSKTPASNIATKAPSTGGTPLYGYSGPERSAAETTAPATPAASYYKGGGATVLGAAIDGVEIFPDDSASSLGVFQRKVIREVKKKKEQEKARSSSASSRRSHSACSGSGNQSGEDSARWLSNFKAVDATVNQNHTRNRSASSSSSSSSAKQAQQKAVAAPPVVPRQAQVAQPIAQRPNYRRKLSGQKEEAGEDNDGDDDDDGDESTSDEEDEEHNTEYGRSDREETEPSYLSGITARDGVISAQNEERLRGYKPNKRVASSSSKGDRRHHRPHPSSTRSGGTEAPAGSTKATGSIATGASETSSPVNKPSPHPRHHHRQQQEQPLPSAAAAPSGHSHTHSKSFMAQAREALANLAKGVSSNAPKSEAAYDRPGRLTFTSVATKGLPPAAVVNQALFVPTVPESLSPSQKDYKRPNLFPVGAAGGAGGAGEAATITGSAERDELVRQIASDRRAMEPADYLPPPSSRSHKRNVSDGSASQRTHRTGQSSSNTARGGFWGLLSPSNGKTSGAAAAPTFFPPAAPAVDSATQRSRGVDGIPPASRRASGIALVVDPALSRRPSNAGMAVSRSGTGAPLAADAADGLLFGYSGPTVKLSPAGGDGGMSVLVTPKASGRRGFVSLAVEGASTPAASAAAPASSAAPAPIPPHNRLLSVHSSASMTAGGAPTALTSFLRRQGSFSSSGGGSVVTTHTTTTAVTRTRGPGATGAMGLNGPSATLPGGGVLPANAAFVPITIRQPLPSGRVAVSSTLVASTPILKARDLSPPRNVKKGLQH